MAANNPKQEKTSGTDLVSVTAWNACYDSENGIIALSCTISTEDSSNTITGVGLILNSGEGITLGSFYAESSNGTSSASPSINLPPGALKVGDAVWAVAYGQVNKQHYFFEERLTIGECSTPAGDKK